MGVLIVQYEDVVVRLFIETLIGDVAKWFQHLPSRLINSGNTMKTHFKRWLKLAKEEHVLPSQLNHIKKEHYVPMRDFKEDEHVLLSQLLKGLQ